MKKILSLALTFAIIVSTLVTMGVVSANSVDANIKTTVIDLTQGVANLFVTTSNTTSTTATVEGGKLKVHISAYERHLTDQVYSKGTWFPNYLLAVDGSMLRLTNGNKAIVEVKYKVVDANGNATWGAQIAIGNRNGGPDNNIYVRNAKKHTTADIGKEFVLTSVFTVDGNYATKIAFAGGGDIEISSIVVHELPAAEINNYAVVKYVDGTNENTEFVKKNAALKTPEKTDYSFGGWYANADFTGTKVESVSADTTVYAKWSPVCTHENTTTTNTATYFNDGVETVYCEDCKTTVSETPVSAIKTAPVTFESAILDPATNELTVKWEYSAALSADLVAAGDNKALTVKYAFVGGKEYSAKLDTVANF
ncbi:MAG: InlB B-repeat-containing protein, partial [Clostridia bacterium]|nr:InlB B-repeat-containing protein [Clostridia bacterium]